MQENCCLKLKERIAKIEYQRSRKGSLKLERNTELLILNEFF